MNGFTFVMQGELEQAKLGTDTRRATSPELRATTQRQRIIDRIVGASARLDAWDMPGEDNAFLLVRRDRYDELTAAVAELIEQYG